MTLEGLLARFQEAGDAAAMDELVSRTRLRLLAVARRIGAPQDAEDSVQSAYHVLLRRTGLDAPVLPWLITTVVRVAYRRKAIQQRQREVAERLALESAESPAAGAARNEGARIVRETVATLPGKYRDVIVLYHLEGLVMPEVAKLLDLPVATVKTRVQRGRLLLQGRLSPSLLHGFLCVPWLVADWGRASAGAAYAMQTKTAVIATFALAAGATGLGLGMQSPPPTPARRVAQSQEDLTGVRAEIATLRLERDRLLRTRTEPSAHPVQPAKKSLPRSRRERKTLEEFAAELGVSKEVLAVAKEEYVRARQGKRDAGEKLALHGDEGFRAAVALLRARRTSVYLPPLFRATWEPGLEKLLIETADDAGREDGVRGSALYMLAFADCDEARDALATRIAAEHKVTLFYNAAIALGRHKDERLLAPVKKKLFAPYYEGVRPQLLRAVADVGTPEAERILLDYLRDHRATHHSQAVRALMRINRGAAIREAEDILNDSRGRTLGEPERRALRKIVEVR